MSTSRIPATRRSAPDDTVNTRYDFTTCPVANAFRWGSYFSTRPIYSLGILDRHIRRMLDAVEEGCEHCSKRRQDTISQYTYWSNYIFRHIRQDRPGRHLSEDQMHRFFHACIQTVEDGCILREHVHFLKPRCCAGRGSSQDESLEMIISSPGWFSSSTSSTSKETVSSATQTPLLPWSRNTCPEREATPRSVSPSPPPPTRSDIVLFQPSAASILPVNSDWLSRLGKIFGFYWQKYIHGPFASLYRWFWDTQANLMGSNFGSRLGLRAPTFYPFAPNDKQSNSQKLLEWPISSTPPATSSAQSVANDDDNMKEMNENLTPTTRMAKTREEVKDMWWKVMAKILLAEHRERREKEAAASTWERASAAIVTESTSFVSSEGDDCSLRPVNCFSTVGSRCGYSQDTEPATSDSSNPEFDEWYAEWFSHWVLETSRKLRSPESESRFSCYSFSPSAAPANGSDHHEDGNASDDDEENTDIRTRPSTPTPLPSPTISPRGRHRYRCLSLSRSSSNSSLSPSRNTSMPSSPVAGLLHSPRRCRSPSPFCISRSSNPPSPIPRRRRTPSPLNITHSPLPLSSTRSPVFPTSSSRSSSPTQSPQHQDQYEPAVLRPRPLLNAKTEDYLSNAHLLRFPATVSARLMMTAETLGVAGEGKRKMFSELQRTPNSTSSVVETKWRRRASEEVKGFDWGFGMGGEKGDGGEEEEEEEEGEGYETH